MTKKIKKIIKLPRVQSMILFAMLFPVLSIGIKWIAYELLPAEVFFHYTSIEPTKDAFINGEELVFKTDYEFKRSVDFEATHKLRCNIIGGEPNYTFYSSQVNEINHVSKKVGQGTFTFYEESPEPPRTCYLKSTLEIGLPLGVKKVQEIESSTFLIL